MLLQQQVLWQQVAIVLQSKVCGAGRGEAGFEALLAASGFAVRHVPTAALHEEYRGGEYRVLRACLLGA